ncbi:MAG: CdaR family protein [Armatimonadota bacterium]
MIRQNLRYKLLALVIALIIWVYADLGQNQNIVRSLSDITVQLKGLEPGYLATCKPDSVKIQLEGSKNHLEAVVENADLITAYVDLRGRTAGSYKLPVRVSLPKGFSALLDKRANPEKASVVLEAKTSRLFNINVQMLSTPPKGYQFGAPMVSPGKAVVDGPARLVNTVRQLVVSLDPGGSSGSIEGDFTVMALDAEGKNIQGIAVNPGKVHLRMDLLESPSSRIVYITPGITGQPPYPYHVASIDVEPKTAVLTGKSERLTEISTLVTNPVNISKRTRTFTQNASIPVPAGLEIAGEQNVKVTVHIELSEVNKDTETIE